jgi:hypothetical protein
MFLNVLMGSCYVNVLKLLMITGLHNL